MSFIVEYLHLEDDIKWYRQHGEYNPVIVAFNPINHSVVGAKINVNSMTREAYWEVAHNCM